MTTVAILGSTGQIGKSLATSLWERTDYYLNLYARDVEKLQDFVSSTHDTQERIQILPLSNFGQLSEDIVVNAIGDGSRLRQLDLGAEIFKIGHYFDDLVTEYLQKNPKALYFYLSSGAVYGFDSSWPVREEALFTYRVNGTSRTNHYPLSKIVIEAKHRCLTGLKIYDVRIFGFFSRYIDIEDGFFLSHVARAISKNEILITDANNLVRDYIGGHDLSDLILAFVHSSPENGPYDLFSRAPIAKFDLLNRLASEFSLRFEISSAKEPEVISNNLPIRPSNLTSALQAGFNPGKNSVDTVVQEIKAMLAR